MRLPPDVVAVLIKIKDYFLLFGPALLIAVSLRTLLFAAIRSGRTNTAGWQRLTEEYLEAPYRTVENLLALLRLLKIGSHNPAAALKDLYFEAAFLTASLTGLFTALIFSPLLFLLRLGYGIALALGGQFLANKLQPRLEPRFSKIKASKNSQPSRDLPQENLWKPNKLLLLWLNGLDIYLGRGIYNFFIAALLTIFVPLRVVESWFGSGQFFGPVLIPLLGLILLPAVGSESALVLALFVKGVSTGSGVAALLSFPLLTLVGLVEYRQRYSLRATLIFALIIWLSAAGIGLLLDSLLVNANV